MPDEMPGEMPDDANIEAIPVNSLPYDAPPKDQFVDVDNADNFPENKDDDHPNQKRSSRKSSRRGSQRNSFEPRVSRVKTIDKEWDERWSRVTSRFDDAQVTFGVHILFLIVVSILAMFVGYFLAFRYLGLADALPCCGTGAILCPCDSLDKFKWMIRSVLLGWGTMGFTFVLPLCIFQKFSKFHIFNMMNIYWTYSIAYWIFGNMSAGFQASAAICATGSTIFVYLTIMGTKEERQRIYCLIAFDLWATAALQVCGALSDIDPKYYAYSIPFATFFLDLMWMGLANWAIPYTQPATASFCYAFVIGCLSGIRFNSLISLGSLGEIITTSLIGAFLEISKAAWTGYKVRQGKEITPAKIMFQKVFIYVEYLPILVYVSLIFADFSPWGRLVETSEVGCAGYPLVPEIKQRWIVVIFGTLEEFVSDALSYGILYWFEAEWIMVPLKFNTRLEYLIFLVNACCGAIIAMEFVAPIIKSGIRGGIQ